MQTIMTAMDTWLGLLIDIGLLLGFFFLWLSWHRNGKRQQQLEQLLSDTAQQLEEATRHLSDASTAIEQLKKQPVSTATVAESAPMPVTPARKPLPAASSAPLPAQNSTQATMIMRMKREGESPQAIAERLDLPLAQVKLMLKLHAASQPGN